METCQVSSTMPTGLVSIIVPIYNRQNFVQQLASTVKNQIYQNWELLVVDDGSTDKTKAMLLELAKKDPRIKVFSNAHSKGPSGARNTGLDNAEGQFIAYLDSDDEWVEEHLSTSVYYLQKYVQLDVISANPLRKKRSSGEVFKFDEIALQELEYTKLENVYAFSKTEAFPLQLFARAITTQAIVGRADLLKNNRWNETLIAAEDNLHNLQLAFNANSVGHIQEYHVIYWAHEENITNCGGSHSPERMEKVEKSFVEFWKIVLAQFPLSQKERRYVSKQLQNSLAWGLSYNALIPQKKYKEALYFLYEAIKVKPLNWRVLKTYLLTVLKALIYSKSSD